MALPPPSCEQSNPNLDMDIDHPIFDLDYTPPEFYVEELNQNSPPGGSMHGRHVPDPPRVTHAYHPKLDGESLNIMFLEIYTNIGCSL
jgi:hypothetical protein